VLVDADELLEVFLLSILLHLFYSIGFHINLPSLNSGCHIDSTLVRGSYKIILTKERDVKRGGIAKK
jgi:hypothetical protein